MGLCIKRDKEESVIILTDQGAIEIKVIEGNNCKLKIDAPRNMGIWRKELLDENNELLERDSSTKSKIVGRNSVHVSRDQSTRRRVGPKEDTQEAVQSSLAETKKMCDWFKVTCTTAYGPKKNWCTKYDKVCGIVQPDQEETCPTCITNTVRSMAEIKACKWVRIKKQDQESNIMWLCCYKSGEECTGNCPDDYYNKI